MCQRFSPYAWAKMMYLRDNVDAEVSAFGITNATDPNLVEDVVLFTQEVTHGSVNADADAIAEMMDRLHEERGIQPFQCTRVWIHTHPKGISTPSGTDEKTFQEEVFTGPDWAVMMIFPKDGGVYARLRINNVKAGPLGQYTYEPWVDYTVPFQAADHEQWDKEIAEYVTVKKFYGNPWRGGWQGGWHGGYQGSFGESREVGGGVRDDDYMDFGRYMGDF